jgi:hypothetical protein
MSTFTEDQKADIRALLANPLLQQALQNALSDVLLAHSGASTVEAAALSYKVGEGAKLLVSQLYASADAKRKPEAGHARFRPEAPIS